MCASAAVAEQLAVFAVDRNEVARAHEIQQQFLLFLAGVAGNVDRAAVIVVIHQGALAEHVVQHPEDGFFVAGNDARGEDHRIALIEREQAVVIHGDARKRGHGLGLAAADQDDELLRRKRTDVLRAHHQAVGNRSRFMPCAISTLSTMLRPIKAILRPAAAAMFTICWMRGIDEAKQETITLRVAARVSSSMRGRTVRSEGV